jgi:hypothetical protein
MRLRFFTGAAALTAVTALVTGCAGGTMSTPRWPSSSARGPVTAYRPLDQAPFSLLLAGKWHPSASSCGSSWRSGAKASEPDVTHGGGTLFVSQYGSGRTKVPIREYVGSGNVQAPIGSFVNDAGSADGITVDGNGNFYVPDYLTSYVYVFPQGQDTPSASYIYQIYEPIFAAADSKGNVYVINDRGGPILIFAPGSTTPTQMTGFVYPTSLTFDDKSNMYIVDHEWDNGPSQPLGAVFKLKHGTTTPVNLGLSGLDFPVGITLNPDKDIFVSNLGNNTITEYAPGTTTPEATISTGICAPVYITMNAAHNLVVANNDAQPKGSVTIYHAHTWDLMNTLTDDMSDPRGVAVNPNWQPSPTPTPSPKPTKTP